jgi:hypothetical protein
LNHVSPEWKIFSLLASAFLAAAAAASYISHSKF